MAAVKKLGQQPNLGPWPSGPSKKIQIFKLLVQTWQLAGNLLKGRSDVLTRQVTGPSLVRERPFQSEAIDPFTGFQATT
jgi:hypothetical protein